jgi:hypothetical protein
MCPVCIATAVLIAGKVTSTAGLAAIAVRKLGVRNAVDNQPVTTPSVTTLSKEDRHEQQHHNESQHDNE